MDLKSLTITPDQLRARLDQHEPITVLDVRTTEEREEWVIPGSIHIDAYDDLKSGNAEALAELVLPQDQPVVTVCAAGNTSLVAAGLLRDRGIDAVSLDGGMKGWSQAWNVAEVPLKQSDTSVVQVRRTGKGCLSCLIGSQGRAAVIDAALDPQVYIDLARRYGWQITHILETHVHADHLMRARLLAEQTGAKLFLPATERVAYPHATLHDGDVLDIGAATVQVLHTPGHTPESTTYLLDNEALFTGDTLFLEGVGRPDLEASPEDARARAHALYRSLTSLLALPPETLVLPGHTSAPVAFDGIPLSATLAEIRARVDLLRVGENAFVESLLARIPPTPPNHHRIVELNEAGIFPEEDPTDLEAGANRCAIS